MSDDSHPALRVDQVAAQYGSRSVLSDITFDLERGAFLGVIGPNGSGKTTLLRAVSAAIPLSGGSVQVLGRDLGRIKRRKLSQMLAFVPQSLSLPVAFSVKELVSMGRIPYVSGWTRLSARDKAVVDEVILQMDVAELACRPVNELSAGEQQRALVAMALAQEPDILLLDEPTAYLDIQHSWKLMELVCELNQAKGVAVLISLHDLTLAAEFCEHLLLLENGRVASFGKSSEVLQAEILSRVYTHSIRVETTDDGRTLILPQRSK